MVSQVTLDLTPADKETTKKAAQVMTKIIKKIVTILQNTPGNEDNYNSFMACKEFKVSFELPENNNNLFLYIFYTYTKDTNEFPLSEGTIDFTLTANTSKLLKKSLTPLATSTKASATRNDSTTLPTRSQEELLLQSTFTQLQASDNPLRPGTTTDNKSRTTDASSTKVSATRNDSTTLPTLDQQKHLLEPLTRKAKSSNPDTIGNKSRVSLPTTPSTSPLLPSEKKPQVAETSHHFIYRFFAALFNWIASFFYDSSEEPKADTTDVEQGQSKAGQRSTSGSKAQTKTTGTEKVVASIRGLSNGNNICFINAIFQALMNTSEEMINVIINAHDAKIQRQHKEIEDLESEISTEESSYFLPIWNSPKRARLQTLEASREASITLNQALGLYNTTQDMVWLNALRGFDSAWSRWSQQDARELLDKIFDPVLEPLTGGLGKNGLPSLDIIPENIDPNLKTSLSRFFPKFGIRKQWVLESEDSNLKNVTQLPDGIHEEVNIDPIPRFEIPNDPTTLQDVVTTGLTMQQKQLDDTAVYEINGKKGTCRIAQECLVIQSIEGNAPEYIPLQLKRFNDDLSKNETEIIMPENNRITLIVNGQDVDYEIHTLVMHEGEYLSGGHYFSYVRKNNGWVEANDSRVIPLTELPETVEKQVYMIFLKRVDREVI